MEISDSDLTVRYFAPYGLIAVTLFFNSCKESEDPTVLFSGSVKYYDSNSMAIGVPLTLVIFDNNKPLDRTDPNWSNVFLVKDSQSSGDGSYFFSVPFGDLPSNTSYVIRVSTDTLIQINTGVITPICESTGGVLKDLDGQNQQNNLFVDHPAIVEVVFNKMDPSSTDQLRYSFCRLVYETSINSPNLKISHTLPFSLFPGVRIQYEIIKTSGEVLSEMTDEIPLGRNNLTKVIIEY